MLPRFCVDCGETYLPTGRNQKRCPRCGDAMKLSRSREHYDTNFRTGQGSGGNQQGANNHMWKGGVSPYMYMETKLTNDPNRLCERCGADLSIFIGHTEYKGYWVVHHKDGDDTNNVDTNLELLCKSCHQIEHRAWENFNAKV